MLLDTNILIALFDDEKDAVDKVTDLTYQDDSFYISTVSITEILALSSLSNQEITKIKLFLSNFIFVPFDNQIAELTATLIRKYQIKLPDASIAASALILNTTLVSCDRRLQKIKEIKVIRI